MNVLTAGCLKQLSPHRWRIAAVAVLIAAMDMAHADSVDARCDIYPKGSDRASGVVACTFSQRQGQVSIDRADGVRHELSAKGKAGNYVDQDGKAAYRNRGLGDRGLIFRLATESVYVYWDTAGLPGQSSARATNIAAAPAMARAPKVAPARVPFDKTLTLQGVKFRVVSANNSSVNQLEIIPAGLEIDNRPISRTIEGTVTGAEVADLNADGSPEIYVFVNSAGSGSYGSLVAYGANRRKSLNEIYLPPITDHPTASKGYMGHDEFAVVENVLARRFPIYEAGDTNAAATGGTRQLQYKLTAGEAGWVLRLDRVVDY